MGAAFGVLLALLLSGFQDLPRLIEELRSGTIEERDRAVQKLREAGAPALPLLEAAAKEKDPEVSARAKYILRAIELDSRISAGLRKAVPKIVDRLASGDPHLWTELFLQLGGGPKERRHHPDLKASDLDPLVAAAIGAAAVPSERLEVLQVALSWRLPSLGPEAARLLGRETNPVLRQVCVLSLAELDHRPAAPLVAEMALDDEPQARRTAIRALRLLGRAGALPVLKRGLADKAPAVRTRAAQALGQLEAHEAQADLVALLKDPNYQARAMAATALGQLRAASAAGEVVALLKDKAAAARGEAALALAAFGDAERTGDLLPLTADPDLGVREKAIRALARLGSRDLEKKLPALLADPEPSIRRAAVNSVAALEARDRIPDVVKRLADPDVEVRRVAVDCLSSLRVDPAALEKVVHDADELVRIRVAEAQCGAGSRVSAEWLVDRGFTPLSLNHFRRPGDWAKLQEPAPEMSWEGTPREILERFAATGGWTVAWPEDLPRDDYWNTENVRTGGGDRSPKRRIDCLDRICNGSYAVGPYTVVLEEGRLRVLSSPAAIAFWRAWLQESRERK